LALMALVACAGVQSSGRNARDNAPPPPPFASAPETAPETTLEAPEAPVAAPDVSIATPPPPRPAAPDGDIVVRGEYEGQVPPPEGDFRSRAQRNEDIRAWDRCVTQVQSSFESDPMRPQLDTPEEYCSRSLGMADRNAVPDSRLRRR
jgi:hypothetical protein